MPRKTKADVEVVVTVAHEHLPRLTKVAASLRAKGLKVSQTLESTGVIAGTAPLDAMAGLRKVPGVAAVEPAGEVHIAPPGSPIQ